MHEVDIMSTQYDQLRKHLGELEKFAVKLNGGQLLSRGEIEVIGRIEQMIQIELDRLSHVLSSEIIGDITRGVASIREGSQSAAVILEALKRKLK